MPDIRNLRKIPPWISRFHTKAFNWLLGEVKVSGAPEGQIDLTTTRKVAGVGRWNGSPLIHGKDDAGRRFIAVKTESQEYIYREGVPERIIDFQSWFVLVEDTSGDKPEYIGYYGDQDLSRDSPAEIYRCHDLLSGGTLVYQTATCNFITLVAERYLEALTEE